jgi:hypothetical protein
MGLSDTILKGTHPGTLYARFGPYIDAGKMEPNLAGSIYVRSSIKLLHLVPFAQQTWLPRLILFSDWLMAGSIYVRYEKVNGQTTNAK